MNVQARILPFSPMNISVIIKLIFPPMIIKLLFLVHTVKTFLLPHAIYFTCNGVGLHLVVCPHIHARHVNIELHTNG